MRRSAHRHPSGLAVDEEWPAICMQGAGCRAPPCLSLARSGDDPSPVAFLDARDDPSVIGWPRHRGEVFLCRLSRFAGIQVPRQEVTVTRDNPPEDARLKGPPRRRRRGYLQFHSLRGLPFSQAPELRLCLNPPQPYVHIVILAAQKAAKWHK
jgi:hypothetical protein